MLTRRLGGFVDLADLRIVLENGGLAGIGKGEAEGPGRATEPAKASLAEPRVHLRSMAQSKK